MMMYDGCCYDHLAYEYIDYIAMHRANAILVIGIIVDFVIIPRCLVPLEGLP